MHQIGGCGYDGDANKPYYLPVQTVLVSDWLCRSASVSGHPDNPPSACTLVAVRSSPDHRSEPGTEPGNLTPSPVDAFSLLVVSVPKNDM